jgi:lysozyme
LVICLKELRKQSWWKHLNEPRQAVMISMCFMGWGALSKFTKLFAALTVQDWKIAADEMLDSQWARQVGQRAKDLAGMMRTGEWMEGL